MARKPMECKQMTRKRISQMSVNALIHNDHIRQVIRDGKTWYAAVDAVGFLTDSQHPEEYWSDLKRREPVLGTMVETDVFDALDLRGLLRLVQAISSPKADRIKTWLADAAAHRLEEAKDPELA